jgi:hypothetical protein
LRIYGSEGASAYVGDHGSSFGPFQLHYGGIHGAGAGNQVGGMGDQFTRETGLDARNPSTVAAQVQWMKKYGDKHGGYSSSIWHGLKTHGGSLGAPREHPRPGQHESHLTIHQNINLDGKQIAKNTAHHLVNGSQHATSVASSPDGHGSFMGPGSEVFG